MLENIIPLHNFPPSDTMFMLFTLLNTLTAVGAGLQPDKDQTAAGQENKEQFNITEIMEVEPLVPSYIKPMSYTLFFNPDLETGLYEGSVDIWINISSNASYIPIHIKDLEVTKTLLFDEKQNVMPINTSYSERNQFWVVNSGKGNFIPPGNYMVNLEFKGKLLGKIVGFYKSEYIDANGMTRNIATTKFEPVDARQAFPCFDEPALKAKFTIRIVRPKQNNYMVLSNMNVLKEEEGPSLNKVTVHFPESVPMSTYLVCFIISDFLDSGAVNIDNFGKPFPVKVYATPAQVSNTVFAKGVAAAVTKFYINYFDLPYPLPKLDLIAIPDFVSGAMENWGLITFRETGLLFNEKENSEATKQRVATVVSHEISHQWFGNLVTMKWWDDLWLNEGFASFMQYKGVDEGIPECKDWQILDHAIHEQIHPVLKRDSLTSSHPIIQPVSNPDQINEIFDSISYNKGHAIIKMLESFMGPENFRSGIKNYLKAYEFSSAITTDLWTCLNREIKANLNIADVMDTWTRQMGYPLVTVEKTTDSWVLKQTRFLTENGATFDPTESPYRYRWDIPISFINDSSERGFVWLKRNQRSVKLNRTSASGYVKLNHKQVGFYRVNYSMETWKVFDNILRSDHQLFDRKDRANLLDDVFSLAEAGIVGYEVALDLVGYLKSEKEFLPWAVGASALTDILGRAYSIPMYTGFRKFVHGLLKDKYGKKKGQLSFNVTSNDTHSQRFLRVKILELACQSGYQPCLQDAGSKFLEWIKKPTTSLHPDVRSLVFRYGMSAVGKEDEWNIVWERYLKETNPQEKMNLLFSLSCSKEPWILSKLLQLAKNEAYIRTQDYFQALTYISMNPIGNPIVWVFFRNEWPYLVKRFSLYHRTLGTFIATVSNGFSTQVEYEEMEEFFRKYPDAGAGANARKLALERVRINIKWLEKSEQPISNWLAKNNFL